VLSNCLLISESNQIDDIAPHYASLVISCTLDVIAHPSASVYVLHEKQRSSYRISRRYRRSLALYRESLDRYRDSTLERRLSAILREFVVVRLMKKSRWGTLRRLL
jgi:hypothetical protein